MSVTTIPPTRESYSLTSRQLQTALMSRFLEEDDEAPGSRLWWMMIQMGFLIAGGTAPATLPRWGDGSPGTLSYPTRPALSRPSPQYIFWTLLGFAVREAGGDNDPVREDRDEFEMNVRRRVSEMDCEVDLADILVSRGRNLGLEWDVAMSAALVEVLLRHMPGIPELPQVVSGRILMQVIEENRAQVGSGGSDPRSLRGPSHRGGVIPEPFFNAISNGTYARHNLFVRAEDRALVYPINIDSFV